MNNLKIYVTALLVLTAATASPANEPEEDYRAAARQMQANQAEQRLTATQRAAEKCSESQHLLRHEQDLEQQELQSSRQLGHEQRRQVLEWDRQLLQQQAHKNEADAMAGSKRLQMLQMSTRAELRQSQSQLMNALQQHGASLERARSNFADKSSDEKHASRRADRRNSKAPSTDPAARKVQAAHRQDIAASTDQQQISEAGPLPALAQLATFLGGNDSDVCKDLARKINDALYRDKRASTPSGGIHGLWHRLREQVSGGDGPGSRKWDGHTTAIENQQKYLRDLLDQFSTNYCGQPPRIARQIASRPAPGPSEWRGPSRLDVLTAKSTPGCQFLAVLTSLTTGLAACGTEGATATLVCAPLVEIPGAPIACGVAGCAHGAFAAATATFALTERTCSTWMSQRGR
jgi:hypothetical protein